MLPNPSLTQLIFKINKIRIEGYHGGGSTKKAANILTEGGLDLSLCQD